MIRRVAKPGRRQAGDTLIEVVISLAILAGTWVSAYNISNTSYSEGEQAREHTQAIYLAQDQAEKMYYYRDYLIANHLNDLAATPTIITDGAPGNFGTCIGGCYVEISGGVPTLFSGELPAAEATPFGSITYHVSAKPLIGGDPVQITPLNEARLAVTTTWDSAVHTGVTAGTYTNQNTTTLNLILVDNRGIVPLDCSVAGIPQCK